MRKNKDASIDDILKSIKTIIDKRKKNIADADNNEKDKQSKNSNISELEPFQTKSDNHDTSKFLYQNEGSYYDNVETSNKNDKNTKAPDVLELTQLVSDDNKYYSNDEALISNKSATDTVNTLKKFTNKVKSIEVNQYQRKDSSSSIEEFMIELIRPQLKKWLDQNLPSLVEELVEKEIKKLIPNDKK
ncbi:MAG: DUF2497 domain-containing protein [Rickettsiaceae bacterium]